MPVLVEPIDVVATLFVNDWDQVLWIYTVKIQEKHIPIFGAKPEAEEVA